MVVSDENSTVTLFRVTTKDVVRQISALPESAGVWIRTQSICLLDSPPYYVEIWKQEDKEGRYFVAPLRSANNNKQNSDGSSPLVERIEVE